MREILFRGKSVGDNNWIYGFYVCFDDVYNNEIKTYHYIVNEATEKYVVKPDTVGQYTDLKDKNGNKIFEGDIIKLSCIDTILQVIYKGGVYKLITKLNGKIVKPPLHLYPSKQLEVVGNVYDNPELMND